MANLSSDAQGLQNLLQSFAPDAVDNVTPEALQRLTEKLSELMGEDVVRTAFSGADQGPQLVDITDQDTTKSSKHEAALIEETPLVPFSSLLASERSRRKEERDRILDMLEEEDEEEQRKTDEKERLERKAAMEKRREASKGELDRLRMVKETHKKMGKALMRSMAEARESREVEEETFKKAEAQLETRRKEANGDAKKKTVSFIGVPDSPSPLTTDWGDLSKGKLRASSKPNGFNKSELLMKKNVVERIPAALQSPPPPRADVDSDDESEPELHVDQDVEEDEFDMDYAFQQREIALAYEEKRQKIGEEAALALTSHTHEPDEEPAEKSKSKTPLSKFRANRFASAFAASSPSVSQSLGASVVPATAADTLQRAIRMGTVDDQGRLVGGDYESDEEDNSARNEQENEAVQEVLDLLKKGQVYNLGPEGGIHTVSPPENAPKPSFTVPSEPPPSAKQKEKAPSKFKLARSGGPSSGSSLAPSSGSGTPVSSIGRSSPKIPAVLEHAPPTTSSMVVESPSFQSMVIESPSFPAKTSNVSRPERPPAVMAAAVKEKTAPTNVVESPSTSQSASEPPKRISRFKAERI